MADDRVVLHFLVTIAVLLIQNSEGCQVACSAVGTDDSNIIPDSSFTASSQYNDEYGAKKARFSSPSCWSPYDNDDLNGYLQIDLGKAFVICAVATKGGTYSTNYDEWTTEYKISTSSDKTSWISYSDNNKLTKLFSGNKDENTAVKNELAIPVLAKWIRFTPIKYIGYKCLRVEVYGIDIKEPQNFTANVINAKSINLSWDSPPCGKQYGIIITGYKLWYCKTCQCSSPLAVKDCPGNGTSTVLDNLTMYTQYTFKVLASTSVGDSPYTTTITRRTLEGEPDAAPQNFTAIAISSTSFNVSWDLPPCDKRNGIIKGYKLWYCKTDDCSSLSVKDCPGTSTVLDNLDMYTEYTFKVLAYTSVGDGPNSTNITRRTLEGEPDAAPQNFTAIAISSTSFNVSWDLPPCDKRNGIIKGYKLWYCKTDDCSSLSVKDCSGTSTVLDNLDMYTQYTFKVLAYTSVGDGPNSTNITRRTLEGQPDAAPQNFTACVINATSLSLSWYSLPCDKRNGIITGYKLWYCKSTDHCSSPSVKNYTGTSTVLDNLDMYTQYTFKVLAYTSVGDGPNSTNITRRTLEGAPSAPTNVKTTVIYPVGSTGLQVKIEWNPPSTPNGIIRGYNVSYGQTRDSNIKMVSLGSNNLSFSFDVCAGLNYTSAVWAYTILDGAKENKTVNIDDFVPIQPAKPKVAEYNTTTFHVSFQPLPSTNGRIIVYELEIVKNNSIQVNKTMVNVSCGEVPCRGSANHNCSHALHYLQPAFMYNIKVRAYTIKGAGPYSEAFVLQTSEDEKKGNPATAGKTLFIVLSIGVAAAVIIILLLVIGFLIYLVRCSK